MKMEYIDKEVKEASIVIEVQNINEFENRCIDGSFQQAVYNHLLLLKEELGKEAYAYFAMKPIEQMFALQFVDAPTSCNIRIILDFYTIVVAVINRFKKELLYA